MLEKSQFRNSQYVQEKMEALQEELQNHQFQMDGIEAKLEVIKKGKDAEIDMIESIKKMLDQLVLQKEEKNQEENK